MTATQKPLIASPDWIPADAECTEPSGSKKSAGWNVAFEKPTRKNFNWLFKSLSAWISWFKNTEDEYYVNASTGSDAAAGASGTPLATISAALAKVRAGVKTTIWLSNETHHIAADIVMTVSPNVVFDNISGTPVIEFDAYISGGAYNALYGIEFENGYIELASGVGLSIPNRAHGTYPWGNMIRLCFRVKGMGQVKFSGTTLVVGTASSDLSKPAVVGAYENGFVSIAIANEAGSALATGDKAYILDLGGIPAGDSTPVPHACGSISGDATMPAGIDNIAYLVVGRKTIIVSEQQTLYFDAVSTDGTFDLYFGDGALDAASNSILVQNIAHDESNANIATAINNAFDAAGWSGIYAASVTSIRTGTDISTLIVSLDSGSGAWAASGEDGMPRMTADIAGLSGHGTTKCWSRITRYPSKRKDINLVTNLEL